MSPAPLRRLTCMGFPSGRRLDFSIHGPIAPGDLAGLCGRVCRLLDGARPEVAVCDVGGLAADAVAVDALARLQLAARHYGCVVRLRRATEDLRDLVAFMGLQDVLPEE